MRKPSRQLLSVLSLPVSLLLGMGAQAAAQDSHAHMDMPAKASSSAAHASRWSDPASWPDGKVPRAGDAVTIGRDKDIVLDVDPPALRSLTINGKLSFSNDRDHALTSEWIYLSGGELAIGSEARPYTHKATITLTDNVPNEDVNTMGDRGIMMLNGTLELHGDRTNTWTKLASTAKAGSSKIEVLNASGWRKGDAIVLASTDFDPHQAERRTIAAVSGNTLTLDRPLAYMHFGQVTYGVDERGEVGLLTRNIKIQASDDAETSYFGGHIMAMAGSQVHISGVELNRMGQNMHLARYPMHWHIVGDAKGQYFENSSIHDTYSRCLTVHGTNDLMIKNNVTYNNVGHCFFLEDAVEHGNQIVHNLAILTKCHPDAKPCEPTDLGPFGAQADGKNFKLAGQDAKDILIPSDNTASSFWITNPDNTYIGNVAAGSEATGFWLATPQHPTGAFLDRPGSEKIWPRSTPLREFKGNTAHSNFDGFMFDRGPRADGHFGPGGHMALADPGDPKSPVVETVFEDLTGYKNRNSGLWARGEMDTFRGLKMADNAIGYTHASGNFGNSGFTSRVVDSLFVGESDNVGNPTTPSEVAYGRSLPEPEVADFPIRGYEFYDYKHHLDNITFVNFQDNATRKTGAISYLLYTSFGMSTNNTVEHARFVNAKPVYFPPLEHRWSNDDYGNGSYKTSVFHDVDGSVTGTPDSFILINDESNSLAIDRACEIKTTWNAAVCRGDYGRFTVGALGGPGLPGFGGPPAGPPRGAAAGAGAGAAAAPRPPAGPGGLFGRPAGPPQPPVVVSREGKALTLTGDTNVRAGTEIKLVTERPSVALRLSELDKGSWVMFELPGFTKAATGAPQQSLDALRQATATSYYKGQDALWVKVVSSGEGARIAGPGAGGTSVEVMR